MLPELSVTSDELPTQGEVALGNENEERFGAGFTVITVAIWQPVASVYVMLTLPPATPVTIPLAEPTVAIIVLLLVHVPPVGVELNVIVAPGHTVPGPVIVLGSAFTVIGVTMKQPVGMV